MAGGMTYRMKHECRVSHLALVWGKGWEAFPSKISMSRSSFSLSVWRSALAGISQCLAWSDEH